MGFVPEELKKNRTWPLTFSTWRTKTKSEGENLSAVGKGGGGTTIGEELVVSDGVTDGCYLLFVALELKVISR